MDPQALVPLDTFRRALTGSRGRAGSTANAYSRRVADFLRWARPASLGSISRADVRLYLDHLAAERHLSPASLRLALAALRAWFRHLLEVELIHADPSAGIAPRPLPHRLPRFLTPAELHALLTGPRGRPLHAERDRAIVAVLALAGLRASEVLALDIDHVLLDHRLITVTGKGQRQRNIPMHPALVEPLEHHLATRPRTACRALFLSQRHTRLSSHRLREIVRDAARTAGITRLRVHPHLLRHSFASALHAHGADLLHIRDLLGHASLTATQVYVHTDAPRLRAAVTSISLPAPP